MREDLAYREKMESAGFKIQLHRDDIKRVVPQHDLTFIKGDIYVWRCYAGWQVARLKDGKFEGHAGNPATRKGFVFSLDLVLDADKDGGLEGLLRYDQPNN